ncbi:UNVERIFIED_CONTAM: hypothetical protein Slati_3401700 [Sesamum latifolium]|uniref:Uncharacterized protein n=1 Tax=Sesamum latifolium TaxID=2727402 RepID=A0AAW2UGJ9_9LAMI
MVRGHFPHPWPCLRQVPSEHQRFCFESMKIPYWWDCDDESMFGSSTCGPGSTFGRPSPSPGPAWSGHYGWPTRSGSSYRRTGPARTSSRSP